MDDSGLSNVTTEVGDTDTTVTSDINDVTNKSDQLITDKSNDDDNLMVNVQEEKTDDKVLTSENLESEYTIEYVTQEEIIPTADTIVEAEGGELYEIQGLCEEDNLQNYETSIYVSAEDQIVDADEYIIETEQVICQEETYDEENEEKKKSNDLCLDKEADKSTIDETIEDKLEKITMDDNYDGDKSPILHRRSNTRMSSNNEDVKSVEVKVEEEVDEMKTKLEDIKFDYVNVSTTMKPS